jgi:hypothetical protein
MTSWTVAQPDTRPLPTQNTTQKDEDKHPCPVRDSNPQCVKACASDHTIQEVLKYFHHNKK